MFDLRSLVSGPFLVVGGVATRLYAPERMTDDLDVLVAMNEAEVFYEDSNLPVNVTHGECICFHHGRGRETVCGRGGFRFSV